MQYFSLFSGVGGFEIGIERDYGIFNRHKEQGQSEMVLERVHIPTSELLQGTPSCIGFSEIDKYASSVLKYRFPNVPNYGDITKIDWSTVPDFDLLVGGSPCQDLSVAGKRAGLEGGRSGLFYDYLKALEVKKPQHFIWENVKGALSSNDGRDFAAIVNAFSEAGYSLWWQVLNAKDFGVPQNRERIFIVGTRNGSPRGILFERREDGKNLEFVGSASERDWAGDGKLLSRNSPQGSRIYSAEGIMPTLAKATGGHGRVSGLVQNARPVIRQPLRFLKRNQKNIEGDYAFTVDASQTSGVREFANEIGDRIRRLTPRECERLMSWPDDWTRYGINDKGERFEISDSQRYKMCGNGVVSNVVQEVIKILCKKPSFASFTSR